MAATAAAHLALDQDAAAPIVLQVIDVVSGGPTPARPYIARLLPDVLTRRPPEPG